MPEYIEREKLLCSIGRNAKNFETAKDIEQAGLIVQLEPAADVVEVKHGEWLPETYTYFGLKRYICSQCRDDEFWDKRYVTIKEKYCPNCGAKMEGGNNG